MNEREATWKPLLTGALAAKAELVLDDVAAALRERPSGEALSLADGRPGAALYYHYLAQRRPGGAAADWAAEERDRAVDALAEREAAPSLFTGFAGVAWLVEHLQGAAAPLDADDANEAIDEALLEQLAAPWTQTFDLVGGLAGLGVYACERARRPSGRACLAHVVAQLAAWAEPRGAGVSWRTPQRLVPASQRATHPHGYFDLGVAHGVPAVALVLAAACALDVERPRARPLLDGAMRWLWAAARPEPAPSAFGYYEPFERDRQPPPARSGWCYGDAGAALTLHGCARAVGDDEWRAAALAIGRRAAARPLQECGVVDSGLCHGAAGLALIHHRLWQASGEPLFADAARRWYEQTLERHRPGHGLAGYQSFSPSPQPDAPASWRDDPAFLTGISGIGLALLAGLGIEPHWDRLLALTLPRWASQP